MKIVFRGTYTIVILFVYLFIIYFIQEEWVAPKG